jgi:glycoprotein-N-acetylgalactosamine 3-beta-galactosyltransferase
MPTTLYLFSFILLVFFTTGLPSSHQRIYCVIKTFGQNLATRALTIHQTWARRCDKHVFLTATNLTKWNNISLPLLNLFDVGDNYLELSIKVFDALNLLIQQPYDFDWLFLADDDTYVIMEHLRQLLYASSKPLAFGHVFAPNTGAPVHLSGGAGYAINTIALQRMLPNLQTTCAEWYVPGMEDVYVSRCLQHLNVTLNGAIDGNHHRFYPLDFVTMYKGNIPKWFSDYNTLKSYYGFDCCSSEAISFHYMTREAMNLIEWARYLHDNK